MLLGKYEITIKCIAWSIFQLCRHDSFDILCKAALVNVRFRSLLDNNNLQTHFYYNPSAAFQPPHPPKKMYISGKEIL